MTIDKLIKGLKIFRKYYDKDGYHNGAEHDQFYVYVTDREMSKEDVETVINLGWFQPDVRYDGDFKAEHYNFEEGWSTYL